MTPPASTCKRCGSPVDAHRPWQKFCSPACRKTHWDEHHDDPPRERGPRHEVQMPDELWAWVGERAGRWEASHSDVVCFAVRSLRARFEDKEAGNE